MRALAAWLLASGLLLASFTANADLRLRLDDTQLTPPEREASQALLGQAMAALPPAFIKALDREVRVSWTDNMPADAYGQASLVSTLELNLKLLPTLVVGSAATTNTGRPHGTVRQE